MHARGHGRLAGTTQQRTSKIESCETVVSLIALVALCRILRVPVKRLLEHMQ